MPQQKLFSFCFQELPTIHSMQPVPQSSTSLSWWTHYAKDISFAPAHKHIPSKEAEFTGGPFIIHYRRAWVLKSEH